MGTGRNCICQERGHGFRVACLYKTCKGCTTYLMTAVKREFRTFRNSQKQML